MSRVFNFCAGPAALPQAVLEQASAEMLDWQGSGMSVMEMSHRSAEIVAMTAAAEADLRELLTIPDDYAVLFLQGGATQQFAAVPLNLLADGGSPDYVNTGQWSKKAIAEAQRYIDVNVVASGADSNFTAIPDYAAWQRNTRAAYLHYTPNETIGGVEFHWVPDSGDIPLVVDMSSTILSRPIDVGRFGVIYAGAQKNIGPAGLTLVIVRRELLGRGVASLPTAMNWQVQADNDSMYNTPPTFALYLSGLVFRWLKGRGGLAAMAAANEAKAARLYDYIDGSGFYRNPVETASRSWMNVPFTLAEDRLDKTFLSGAETRGLMNLKGHRSVGGMRASIYNAVGDDAVTALIDYMREFAAEHG